MEMSKKGQVSVFIVLGILVLAIVGSFLFTKGFREEVKEEGEIIETTGVSAEFLPIKTYVDECLRQTSENAILLAGAQGGFTYIPEDLVTADTQFAYIPYWVYDKVDLGYNRPIVESNLNLFIDLNLDLCISNFTAFNYNITFGDHQANVIIARDNVIIELDYPITLKIDDKINEQTEFRVDIPVRLGRIINIARKVTEKEVEDPDYLDLSFMLQQPMQVDAFFYEDNKSVIFKIIDDKSLLKNEPYMFLFAERFDITLTDINYPPELYFIPNFNLNVGDKFYYYAIADDVNIEAIYFNESLRFDSVSDLFVIDPETGLMSFNATDFDIGEHFVKIEVTDKFNETDIETFTINIQA